MREISRAMLAASLIGAMAGGAAPIALTAIGSNVSAKATTGTKAAVNKTGAKINRLTSSNRSGRYWLIPNNKESFKQARRKQLAKRSFKKSKKNGRT